MNTSNTNNLATGPPNSDLALNAQPTAQVVSSPVQPLTPPSDPADLQLPERKSAFRIYTKLENSSNRPPELPAPQMNPIVNQQLAPPQPTNQQLFQTNPRLSFGEVVNQRAVWCPPLQRANEAPVALPQGPDDECTTEWDKKINEFSAVMGKMLRDERASVRLEKFLLSDGFQKILKKYPSVEDKRKAQEANRLWFKLQSTQRNFKEVINEMKRFEPEPIKKCCEACDDKAFDKNWHITKGMKKLIKCENAIQQIAIDLNERYKPEKSSSGIKTELPSPAKEHQLALNQAGIKRKLTEEQESNDIPSKMKDSSKGTISIKKETVDPSENGFQAQHIQPTLTDMNHVGMPVSQPQQGNAIVPFGSMPFNQNLGMLGALAPQQTAPLIPQLPLPSMYQPNLGINAPHLANFAMAPQQQQMNFGMTPEQIAMAQQNFIMSVRNNPMMNHYIQQQAMTQAQKEMIAQFLNYGSNIPGINMLNLNKQ